MRSYVAVNENGCRIGETHHRSTISDATVDLIRAYHEDEGWSYERISRRVKIPACTIEKICQYTRRAQTPERWKRVR